MLSNNDEYDVDKMDLLKRYGKLLKTTVLAFVFSTLIHISIVVSYYYIYLYMNPDDPGKKKFYSTTTTSPGVKIGNRVVGRGAVQTNNHKSYLLHLVREHYKSMSKIFFLQFSIIYLILLFLFKFFPEREKLRVDTINAFHLSSPPVAQNDQKQNEEKEHSKTALKERKKKGLIGKARKEKPRGEEKNDDEFTTTEEEIEEYDEEVFKNDTISNDNEALNEQGKKDN